MDSGRFKGGSGGGGGRPLLHGLELNKLPLPCSLCAFAINDDGAHTLYYFFWIRH